MNNDLPKQIQSFFGRPDVKGNLVDIANKYFKGEKQRMFLYYFDLVKTGQNNIDDVLKYLVEKMDLDLDTAMEINEELFDKIFVNVYYDLADFYEQTQRGRLEKYVPQNESSITEKKEKSKLEIEYSKYINSSLFQNASSVAEELGPKISQDMKEFKNIFYQSINANDEIKVIGMLMIVFQSGVKKFFIDDKRYEDFLNSFLSKKGPEEIKEFEQNKVSEKYVILFLRLILEKKLKFDENKSAMVGETLGSLALKVGEQEFLDIAYGDEALGKFVWKGL